jgi:D-apiose dehydrogenase
MSDIIRGGVIGCGHWATNHLNGWREVKGGEIIAICDINEDRLNSIGQTFGFSHDQRYVDPQQMIKEQGLDFIDIITPPNTHRTLTELGAKHGLHVICQKPMSMTMEDSRAMVRACNDAGVTFMIHENFRWQPAMMRLRELLPQIGDIRFGRIMWRSGYDIYKEQPYLKELEKFITADLAIHLFDLARFFMGEAESIYCILQSINPTIKGEDVGTYLLRMKSGATCNIEASFASHPEIEPFPQTYVLLRGNEGTLRLDHDYKLSLILDDNVQQETIDIPKYAWSTAPYEAIQQSVINIQQHWIDCLNAGRLPDTSGVDSLRTIELVIGAYESAVHGQPYLIGTL